MLAEISHYCQQGIGRAFILGSAVIALSLRLTAQDLSQSQQYDGVAARLELLNNIEARFATVTNYTPSDVAKRIVQAQPGMHVLQGEYRFTDEFSRLDDRFVYHRIAPAATLDQSPPRLPTPEDEVTIIGRERRESMQRNSGFRRYTGDISNDLNLPAWTTIDFALGIRLHKQTSWLDPRLLKTAEWVGSPDDDRVTVRLTDERHLVHVWTYQLRPHTELLSYIVLGRSGESIRKIDCSDFVSVQGVWLPKRIVDRLIYTDSDEVGISQTTELDVSEYAISPADNVPEKYRLAWPLGALVLDKRTGTQLVVSSKSQVIEDKKIFDAPAGVAK